MSDLAQYICDECGYDGFRAIDFIVVHGCPACGFALRRDDPLGAIEAALLPAENVRDIVERVAGGRDE